eukprot:1154330-Pelagomonas_calceolata.AAC.3
MLSFSSKGIPSSISIPIPCVNDHTLCPCPTSDHTCAPLRAVSKAFTLKLDRQNTNGSEAAKEKAKVVQVMDAENSYQEVREKV